LNLHQLVPGSNADQFHYVPGRFLSCWVLLRHAGNALDVHALAARAGVAQNLARLRCSTRFEQAKAAGERAWMRGNVNNTQPAWSPDSPERVLCICGDWLKGDRLAIALRRKHLPSLDYCPHNATAKPSRLGPSWAV